MEETGRVGHLLHAAWSSGPFFPVWTFYAIPWLTGLLLTFGFRLRGRRWHQAFGLGLMTVPLWDTLWNIIDSFGPLLAGGAVLQAFSRHDLSGFYSSKILSELGYLGAGFLLWASDGTWGGLLQTPSALARKLRLAGLPLGGRGEGDSMLLGFVAVPVLVVSSLAIDAATSGVKALHQSDESNVFANMTVYHALLLSLAAAFGEELLFRGLLQTTLGRWMPMPIAIVLQAVVFGFAHAGYATWIHILLPFLFGLAAGAAAWRWGVWMAITIHFMVDFFDFLAAATTHHPWVVGLLDLLVVANILLSLVWCVWWIARRAGTRTPA